MTTENIWATKVAGADCPFDLPRTKISEVMVEIEKLSISTLYLEKIQTYRGHCVLVFDPRHITRIDEMSADEWRLMSRDIRTTELALMRACKPDHINIASLGQIVPHLHWHIIPRYLDDPRWGGPIWTTSADEMQKTYLKSDEYDHLAKKIAEQLKQTDT